MKKRYVVIMAGGNGERFWPESRKALPKQFLPIVGELPMLTQTVRRLQGLIDPQNIFIITGAQHRSTVLDICPELDADKVIGEPQGRDTAAAVALATVLVARKDPDAVFAMLPADAVIQDREQLCSVLESAFLLAESKSVLVTIGIVPTQPATGYGYIERSEAIQSYAGHTAYAVSRFVEKPELETAKAYLESGNYFWNAGMFIWSVASIRLEFEKNCPELWESLASINPGLDAGESLESLLSEIYPKLEKISIDYAIIEKANSVVMIESTFDWDDVGEWLAIPRHHNADLDGNCFSGTVCAHSAKENLVINRKDGHLIALLGVDDLIVVHTDDATLICKKEQAQQIKGLVRDLSKDSKLNAFT